MLFSSIASVAKEVTPALLIAITPLNATFLNLSSSAPASSSYTIICALEGFAIITSERAGVHKPNPKIFQFALAEANTNAASAVFIDDSYENVTSAENMGINAYHYMGFSGLMKFINYHI